MGSSHLRFVADYLERLIALPLVTETDEVLWDKVSASLQTMVQSQFPEFEFEHHVWHFLTDSDIRRTDGQYRERQHRAIVDYIKRLRSCAEGRPNHSLQ